MKLFKYITIAFSSLFMCGCSDYLDNAPDDTLTMEMVFNDRTRTEDWLSGVYNRIPDNYWDLLKVWGYDSMGDDLDPSQRWYQWWGNSLNFIIGQWFTSSTWDAAIWSANPIRIRSAYLFIENAHALPDQGVSEANIERMKDECRFLIAYYYWQMIEAYGSVPFFDGLADVNDPNLMRGQMPFDEMVDWIDAQLVDLSKKLPASYLNESTQFYGRATSIMCLAVRARMLLFAASPLVNGNEWYAGFKNYDGKFRFSQTYDPAKWKRAADANRELIEAAHAPVMIWYVNIMPMAVLILSCLVIMCFSCAAIRIRKLCSSVPTVISVSLKNMLLRVELPVTAVWVSIRHWSMPSP